MSVQAHTSDATDRIEWIEDLGRVRELAARWRALASEPFSTPDWFFPWWDAFSDGRSLRVCLAWRGERLVGVAPMVECGACLAAPVNAHTPFFDFAASDERARATLARGLAASRERCVDLDVLPANSPTVAAMLAARKRRRVVTRSRYLSPIVDTTVSADSFRARSKPLWHAPLDRFRRKMVREHSASFRLVELPEALDLALDRGFAVEASGWKGAAGTAIVSDPTTERFYRSVAHAFAAHGQAALSWIEFGSEMAAFDLSLLFGRRLYLLKTGFDERFRRVAPGLVLRLAVIERCIESDVDAHELLGVDAEWKLKFADAHRSHVELRMYDRGMRGSSGWAYRRYVRPSARAAYLSARRARRRGH